jgi:DNA-binding NarL/FixJ family response regulator
MTEAKRPSSPEPPSDPAEPLQVLVTALNPRLAACLQARLASHHQRVVARLVPLTDFATTPPAPTRVILFGTGTTPISRDPTLARLLRSESTVPVVVVSDNDDEAAMLGALAHGAAGYLLTGAAGDLLVDALEQAAHGRTVIDMGMGGRIASRIAAQTRPPPPDLGRWDLRWRERQVLEGLLEGLTNREIARELNIGEETVKTYLRAVYRKLGARDRTHAVAITHGQRPSGRQP